MQIWCIQSKQKKNGKNIIVRSWQDENVVILVFQLPTNVQNIKTKTHAAITTN